MALLEIKNLNLNIGDTPILKDINLTLDEGDSLGLVGESGAGKSMVSLATMGLLPPASHVSGEILFDGENLLDLSEQHMCRIRGQHISMVFQEPMSALNPVKTIGEQIAEGMIFHLGISKSQAYDKTLKLLDQVGLPPSQYSPHRFPHELSGGQRQRVVIAIALALNPKLIIADEPTTALDVTTQNKILNLLRELTVQYHTSLMLITHDLAVVAQMVGRVAVMRHGEIVESNKTIPLFKTMQHPYTKKLFKASTIKPKKTSLLKQAEPLLQVDNLVRQYRLPRTNPFQSEKFHNAVDGVSFDIKTGESLGLVGESGCGKSTLARTLLALNSPTSGRVELLGKNLFDLNTQQLRDSRRHIQVVFQDPYGSFNPRHKIGKIIAEPMHLLDKISPSERNERVAQCLMDVGLSPDDADKYPHQFSGGQRQRIAIARAIITEPKLIVADEAVSALDVSIREQVLDLLGDLAHKRGLSYLFISHDLHVVRAITDRVMIMRDGKIIEHGPTADVFKNPQHPYTQELLAATPDLQKTLKNAQP